MRFTYDPRYNVAYIRFHEKRGEVESMRLSDELVGCHWVSALPEPGGTWGRREVVQRT